MISRQIERLAKSAKTSSRESRECQALWLGQTLCIWLTTIFGLCFSTLNADVVTIGSGSQISTIPLDFGFRSSLYECLYYPEELGFTSATLDSMSLYNIFYSHPANGATKIWMGSTSRPSLIEDWIPSSALTLVFDGVIDYPLGENTITIPLQTPYEHSPGNLVLMVQRPLDTHWYPGVNDFFCQAGTQQRARKFRLDGNIDPSEPPVGTLSTLFPRTTFYYRRYPVNNDLACIGLSGPDLPPAGVAANYQTCVFNNGLQSQSEYIVKLFNSENSEIASLAGGTIQPLQAVYHTFSWIPIADGTETLYTRVFLPGDEIPANDQSAQLEITVLPEGVQAITIGSGDMNNRQPLDFSRETSLWECIYYPDELGFNSGTITALAFYYRFTQSFSDEQITIWMGSSNLTEMNPDWIPSTQLNMLFDGTVSFPAGQNRIIIPLQTPFNHCFGNLVVMIYRPFNGQSINQPDYFRCQRGTQNRAQMLASSYAIDPADPPFSGILTIFPKTTFFHRELSIVHDLTAVSLSGNPMPSAGNSTPYQITIRNQGTSVQENFVVKLVNDAGIELGSVSVTALSPSHTQELTVYWTPDVPGNINIYGKVLLPDDEVPENNVTPAFPINVQAAGTVAITVGNGGATGRMPLDVYYRSSLFETVYPAAEINYAGDITKVQFYNSFVHDLPALPTKIWLGETTLANLSSGWIPSSQLTLVFEGAVDYPISANDILIPLETHYHYEGANLVLMVQRPMDADYYSSSNVFVTQNGQSTSRSRLVSSDTISYDPNDPPVLAPTAMYPKTTFIFNADSILAEEELPLPAPSWLGKAYPNPFSYDKGTTISVSLKAGETGTLSIYNLAGRLVKRFVLPSGFHNVSWNGTDKHELRCASGVYMYRLDSPCHKGSGKVVLLK